MRHPHSICCKLCLIPQQREWLESTLVSFAKACNDVCEYGHAHQTSRQWDLHQACYQHIRRQYGLPANLAIRAIARVAVALRSGKAAYPFQPQWIALDSRTFLLRESDWSVSITLINGREKFHLDIGKLQQKLLQNQHPVSAVLLKKYKSYYLEIALTDKTADRKMPFPESLPDHSAADSRTQPQTSREPALPLA